MTRTYEHSLPVCSFALPSSSSVLLVLVIQSLILQRPALALLGSRTVVDEAAAAAAAAASDATGVITTFNGAGAGAGAGAGGVDGATAGEVVGRGNCGQLQPGRGFGPNMPGKPTSYALTAADCCAFCHATPNCKWWTWNGPPPGNNVCYAKASNASGPSYSFMVSGGTGPGPVVPPPPPVVIVAGGGGGGSSRPVHTIEPTYASWNIDSSCNRGFHQINFTNPNLATAAAALAPSRLRFGGSGNDNLVYGLTPGSPECAGIAPPGASSCSYMTHGCLNASHWDALHAFSLSAGADFIFGVAYNNLQACAEGSRYKWNATNAASLLSYLKTNNQRVWGFELGNEVNNNGGAPCNQTAAQQAAALNTFVPMVRAALPNAVLIGPDTGYRDAQDWLRAYLPLVKGLLHATTHHVYPSVGAGDFNHIETLNRAAATEAWYLDIAHSLAPGVQVWAGEDGPIGGGDSGTCGGNTSVCGTYGSALWYVDDMASRAARGFSQYQRQDLFGGWYGLVNTNPPHPQTALGPREAVVLTSGFWSNFVWKRTVGTSVYNATSSSPNVRAYAFSGAPPSKHAEPACVSAVRQLVLINLDSNRTVHTAAILSVGESYSAWILTPPPPPKDTGTIDPAHAFAVPPALNGAVLPGEVDADNNKGLPDALPGAPVKGKTSAGIALPPLGIAFVCTK